MEIDDELVVKRMVRGENGGYLLKSDNPDKSRFPTIPWHEEARVIGEVSWIDTVPAASVKDWSERNTRRARRGREQGDTGSALQSAEENPVAPNAKRHGRAPQEGSSMKVRRSLLFGTGHDGEQWIGTCPSLDVATVGDTRERAMEALEEAVNLWTESCIQRGSIREALTELGFVPLQGPPLTNDFCQVDDEFYWRFPDYLPSAHGKRAVRALPDATPETGPNFEYRPHTGQLEVGSPRTTTADAR